MENLNLAELLRDCPKGMELYSPIFGKVYLDKIRPHLAIVVTTDKEQGDFKEEFLYDGRYGMNGECMLFPSKGKTTWEGFQKPFKDGDIVTWEDRGSLVAFIYKERKDVAVVKHHFALYTGSLGTVTDGEISLVENEIVFATEEEKQKLFDAIKANGYHWNSETKTLEKLIEPKFKVGNKIVNIHRKHLHCDSASGKISQITDDKYIFTDGSYISISNQDDWELVPNKFDISTLKPFDKVLVRDYNSECWTINFYSHKEDNLFITSGQFWKQCIPYEGNEHLCGKKNDCNKFYKTGRNER